MLKTEINVPSGRVFVIREQTGADDEVITSYLGSSDNELAILDRFLANLVLEEIQAEKDRKSVSLSDIQNLYVRDKYALLIKSRMFSLGPQLKFSHTFEPQKVEEEYVEDLNRYVWDYQKPFPGKGDPLYDPQRIAPYETLGPIEFNLTSGKVVSFDLLRSSGEVELIESPSQNINLELRIRKLSILDEKEKFQEVKNFEVFSGRDMAEIRSFVRRYDFLSPLTTSFDNPFTGEGVDIPLLSLQDFFFPTRL